MAVPTNNMEMNKLYVIGNGFDKHHGMLDGFVAFFAGWIGGIIERTYAECSCEVRI